MITDHAIDEALIEIMRTKKALEALRKARKNSIGKRYENEWCYSHQVKEHAAAKRASMDLTHSLSKLRAGK